MLEKEERYKETRLVLFSKEHPEKFLQPLPKGDVNAIRSAQVDSSSVLFLFNKSFICFFYGFISDFFTDTEPVPDLKSLIVFFLIE